jgi:hypothetical protein
MAPATQTKERQMTNLSSSLKFTDSLERELIDRESNAYGESQSTGFDGTALDWFVVFTLVAGAVLAATLFH